MMIKNENVIPGLGDHGIKHLSSCNDVLAVLVAEMNHLLLSEEDLLRRHLHTQITSSDLKRMRTKGSSIP